MYADLISYRYSKLEEREYMIGVRTALVQDT